jgi:hypothetical protein
LLHISFLRIALKGGIILRATLTDLIADNPNCEKFRGNIDAEAIFGILDKEENIFNMVELSEHDKPALAACLKEIEQYFDSRETPMFDLNDNFSKQTVGKMAGIIIGQFGYEPHTQQELHNSKYFTSATCYRKTGTASLKIVKVIVGIGEQIGGE